MTEEDETTDGAVTTEEDETTDESVTVDGGGTIEEDETTNRGTTTEEGETTDRSVTVAAAKSEELDVGFINLIEPVEEFTLGASFNLGRNILIDRLECPEQCCEIVGISG